MLEIISVGHTLSNFEPGGKNADTVPRTSNYHFMKLLATAIATFLHGGAHTVRRPHTRTHMHRISIWHQNSNLRSAYNLRSSYNLRSAYGNLRSAYNLRLAYDLI